MSNIKKIFFCAISSLITASCNHKNDNSELARKNVTCLVNSSSSNLNCGGYASTLNSSGAYMPISNLPDGIIARSNSDTTKPFNLCLTQHDENYIKAGITYIPLSAADTLFIWADSNKFAKLSCSTTGDTVSNDHFEFLSIIENGLDSFGNREQFQVIKNINLGYELSGEDTIKNFHFNYDNKTFLKYNLYGNNLGNFSNLIEYVSFRIAGNRGYQYGWIKLSISDDLCLNVYELVICTQYNMPIKIGEYL